MKNRLYHITELQQWELAQSSGEYQPKQFLNDGFIHCSYQHQLIEVANRFFQGETNLVILVIDPNLVLSRIVAENLEGGTELYPHIYGKLPLKATINVIPFSCEFNGSFTLPLLLVSK